MLQPYPLTLGERAFLEALELLVKQKASLIKGAHIAMKRNAKDDLVIAVFVPRFGSMPPT